MLRQNVDIEKLKGELAMGRTAGGWPILYTTRSAEA